MGNNKANAARMMVNTYIKRKLLIRGDHCELCGRKDCAIVGHHWRGYEFPVDVWWVCTSCNMKLTGKHNGILSKEQAKVFIKFGDDNIYEMVKANSGISPGYLFAYSHLRMSIKSFIIFLEVSKSLECEDILVDLESWRDDYNRIAGIVIKFIENELIK